MLAARLRTESGDGLAMSVAENASYDAVGLAELVRKREVSPTELVEAASSGWKSTECANYFRNSGYAQS